MAAVAPPFRAEHIGSLLRPPALKAAAKTREQDPQAYAAALDDAMVAAIRMQEEVGLRAVSDGELRRASWMTGFVDALEGFAATAARFRFHDDDGGDHAFRTCRAVAPIRRVGGIVTGEYAFLRARTDRLPKVTMPTPSAFHFFAGGAAVDAAVYPDIEVFWDDLVAAYRAEIAALGELGATYLQLDEVPLAMLCDPAIREAVRADGEDPEALVTLYVGLVNRILAGRPAGMRVGIHLCRGNFRGRWMAAGGYGPVAETLFNRLDVDAFLLEYDSPRAGDFAPLAQVPPDKTVVLGLVGTKMPALEEASTLARRIDEAARLVPLENLCLSPQCGFASVAGGNHISEDDQRAKLVRVVETARLVWGTA